MKIRSLIPALAVGCAAVCATLGIAVRPASPANVDELRLAPILRTARDFARREGERLWPGYGSAPFGFLLVGSDRQVLLCQTALPEGFVPAGRDALLGCDRATRPPGGLSADLLASMTLAGRDETIVMGPPEATGRTLPDWTRVLLHEHFHQYQAAFPGGDARIAALGLASGGNGMWMLSYPFPYADPAVRAAHAAAAVSLADAVEARGTPGFIAAFDAYLARREALRACLPARDWHYLEFQLWKEGVARWTEITLGRRYPDPAVVAVSNALWVGTLARLHMPDLEKDRRQAVYPLGAAEAALMEACGPEWRADYPGRTALGGLLVQARARCR